MPGSCDEPGWRAVRYGGVMMYPAGGGLTAAERGAGSGFG